MERSFSHLYSLYANEAPQSLRCFAFLPDGRRCSQEIQERERAAIAAILKKPSWAESIHDVWDLVTCAICGDHQSGTQHKHALKDNWRCEFPEIDFDDKTVHLRSRYSLRSDQSRSQGSPSSSHRTISPASKSNITTPTRPSGLAPQASQGRTVSAPAVTFSAEAAAVERRHVVDTALTRDHIPFPISESIHNVSTPEEQDQHEEDGPETRRSPRLDDASLTPSSHRGKARSTSAKPVPSTTPSFGRGDAFGWSPWTIRSLVEEHLRKPIPKQNSKGTIYIFEVDDTGKEPIVKIGVTQDGILTRKTNIQNEHRVKFKPETLDPLPGIPIMQLYRLEKLVHADLAYFQRPLFLGKNGSRTCSREYFQVSPSEARKTVNRWYEVVTKLLIYPDQGVDEAILDALRRNRDEDVLDGHSGDADTLRDWRRVNEDHDRRERYWKAFDPALQEANSNLLKASLKTQSTDSDPPNADLSSPEASANSPSAGSESTRADCGPQKTRADLQFRSACYKQAREAIVLVFMRVILPWLIMNWLSSKLFRR